MADVTNGAGAGYGFGSDRFFGTAGLGFNRFTGADQTQFAMATLFGAQFRASSDELSRYARWEITTWGLAPASIRSRCALMLLPWRTDRLRHG